MNLSEKDYQKETREDGFIICHKWEILRKIELPEVDDMIERQVVLKNKTGLHARPASELVAFAKELPCKVYIEHNGKKRGHKH